MQQLLSKLIEGRFTDDFFYLGKIGYLLLFFFKFV